MDKLTNGGVYFVKDSYFEKYNDPEAMKNKSQTRPYYFALKAKNHEDLYMLIPASSQVEKYKGIIQNRGKKGKPTDYIHITKIGDRETALLLNKMIPITSKYIDRPFLVNGVPFKIVENNNNRELNKKVHKTLGLIQDGVKLPFQTNLQELLKQIGKEMKEDQKLNLDTEKPEIDTEPKDKPPKTPKI